MKAPRASCHCGAVVLTLKALPTEVTQCNCSLCTAYGVIWAYCSADDLTIPDDVATDTYAWNGKHVDFHRCATCGCVTHWIPRDARRTQRGFNARLLPPAALARAKIVPRDGAKTAGRRAR